MEALSRGASEVVFVEKSAVAAKALRANARLLELLDEPLTAKRRVATSTWRTDKLEDIERQHILSILEDTDWDGKADKSTVWADDVHIPLSFALTKDGIYVSEEPPFLSEMLVFLAT